MRKLHIIAAAAAAFVATPALAAGYQRPAAPLDDSNSHWLDYKTDISEAKRELRKDLRRANDPGDRADAWDEYRRELADARHDFRKEMIERGYAPPALRRGTVTVEPAE